MSVAKPTPSSSWTRRESLWVALGSVAFAICFGYPIVTHLTHGALSQWALNDWDLNMEMFWVPFHSIRHFHQFPLWDPYKCGGIPLLANPQSTFLTPSFALQLVAGPSLGVHLEVVSHIAIGFAGAYWLAREEKLSPLGAVATAGTFAGSSWYYGHLAVGHCVMMPYAFVPWVIALFGRCAQRLRLLPGFLAGFLMAVILMEGGVYALPQSALILTLLAFVFTLQRRTWTPLLALGVVGVSTLGFAAIKVLPGVAFVGLEPRLVSPLESNHLSALLVELFSRNQNPAMVRSGQDWGFYEYGAYVGILYTGFGLFGCVRRPVQALPWFIISCVLLILAAGNFGTYSPWVLIHKLPLFSSLRLPTRGLILFTLTLAVLTGLGVDAMYASKERLIRAAAVLLVGLALLDSWLVSASYLRYAVIGQEASLPSSKEFHQMSSSMLYGHMFMAAKANTGVLSCYEVLGRTANPRGYDQPGYRGEQYLLGDGMVALTSWTPNRLGYDVVALKPTVLIVNQNYDEGWHLIRGKGEVFSQDGLIAVRLLPAGRQHLEIVYRPRSFVVGLGITMLTFVATLAVWLFERRRLHCNLFSPTGCGS